MRFETFDDDEAEAAGVVAQVRRLRDAGVALSEIAVLYRTGAQSEPIEQALSEAGIGLLVRGGARFFQRAEVRRAMVALRGAMRTERVELTGDLGRDVRYMLGRQLPGAGRCHDAPYRRSDRAGVGNVGVPLP